MTSGVNNFIISNTSLTTEQRRRIGEFFRGLETGGTSPVAVRPSPPPRAPQEEPRDPELQTFDEISREAYDVLSRRGPRQDASRRRRTPAFQAPTRAVHGGGAGAQRSPQQEGSRGVALPTLGEIDTQVDDIVSMLDRSQPAVGSRNMSQTTQNIPQGEQPTAADRVLTNEQILQMMEEHFRPAAPTELDIADFIHDAPILARRLPETMQAKLNTHSYEDIPTLPKELDIGDALTDSCPISLSKLASLDNPVLLKVNGTYHLYEWNALRENFNKLGMTEPTSRQPIDLDQLLSPVIKQDRDQLLPPGREKDRILWRVPR